MDDGGEVRVPAAPGPVSVPGDGHAHRVPLSAFTTAVRGEYACAPELSPLATRMVRFDNWSGHALLAGPVDLMLGSGFTGRAALDFTAPGAAELAFGGSDDCRVVRYAEESCDTSKIAQRIVVTCTVRLHLSRFSAPGERGDRVVVVRERIPVSEVSAVEVRVRPEACSPAPDAVDAEGIVRWEVRPTARRAAHGHPGVRAVGEGEGHRPLSEPPSAGETHPGDRFGK